MTKWSFLLVAFLNCTYDQIIMNNVLDVPSDFALKFSLNRTANTAVRTKPATSMIFMPISARTAQWTSLVSYLYARTVEPNRQYVWEGYPLPVSLSGLTAVHQNNVTSISCIYVSHRNKCVYYFHWTCQRETHYWILFPLVTKVYYLLFNVR